MKGMRTVVLLGAILCLMAASLICMEEESEETKRIISKRFDISPRVLTMVDNNVKLRIKGVYGQK